MSNGTAATNIGSALQAALTALGTPGTLQLLGKHMTQAEELADVQLIDNMQMNPTIAPMLVSALSPDTPAGVKSLIMDGLANPATLQANLSMAKSQLLATRLGLAGLFGG
jgi:hypothetical protein